MSKITFRADDELVDAVESLDASKSDIMRDALRTYLARDGASAPTTNRRPVEESLETIVARHVEEALDRRLDDQPEAGDRSVYVDVDGADSVRTTSGREGDPAAGALPESAPDATDHPAGPDPHSCPQCGFDVESEHVYCPNCGENVARSVYCECGETLHPDWSFCPGCGRRTPSPKCLER